jgi:hypothetical protein
MLSKQPRIGCAYRAMIALLSALISAGALAAQPAFASGKGTAHHARHAKSASTGRDSKSQSAAANARLHAAAAGAVEALVRNSTIDQHQAEVIDRQIDAGSVDPAELVARGVVSESQMRAVEDALAEIKRSFGSEP